MSRCEVQHLPMLGATVDEPEGDQSGGGWVIACFVLGLGPSIALVVVLIVARITGGIGG